MNSASSVIAPQCTHAIRDGEPSPRWPPRYIHGCWLGQCASASRKSQRGGLGPEQAAWSYGASMDDVDFVDYGFPHDYTCTASRERPDTETPIRIPADRVYGAGH